MHRAHHYGYLIERWRLLARTAGLRMQRFATAGRWPLFCVRSPALQKSGGIYLSTGIHGDEPAPPLALLALLEAGVFDARAIWFLCPLLNPDGLARRTRENAGGIDLNRDYLAREKVRTWMASRIPTGAPGRPEDVAQLVSALLGDSIPFLTGETIYIDGAQGINH